MTTVVSLGEGLLTPAETAAQIAAKLRGLAPLIAPLADAPLLLTASGDERLTAGVVRHDRAAEDVPPLPLHLVLAQVQAELGALLAAELGPVLGAPLPCLLTRVRVDPDDPALDEPVRAVGPLYGAETARALEREQGWQLGELPGRGWRRLVPSPAPVEIVELEALRTLLQSGGSVVACVAGGIPVVARAGRLSGVDALLDPERTAALVAAELPAKRLVLLTEHDAVARGFGSDQVELRQLTPDEADELALELPAGETATRVAAASAFVRAAGGEAIVTSPRLLAQALAGAAGTCIRSR